MSYPYQDVDLSKAGNSDQACKQVTGTIKIGTCGFGVAQAEYARNFSCVEVQHTFYEPPRLTTLNRWRSQMPADFEFALKAWQLITHEARSPTYRRLKRKLSETEKAEAGSFRATGIVNEAWAATLAAAQALRAKTILFQCPSSFKQTADNIATMEKFFSSIDRQDLNLCWEPRGDWDAAVVRSICVSLELCHVVDPFIGKTVTSDKYYFRLHGRGGWRYQYELGELKELATSLVKSKRGYVFFNNSKMTEDALKFCKLLGDRKN
jgi:uncharacterized protein YecE (DUF72 family)